MHKLKFVLENGTHKILYDFEIQTDHLISTRRINLVIFNKGKTCCRVDFAVTVNYRK